MMNYFISLCRSSICFCHIRSNQEHFHIVMWQG